MKKTILMMLFLCRVLNLSAQTIVQQMVAVSRGAGTVSDMDISPTIKGSILIAMPMQLSPGIKVLNVTDDAPGGSNLYKQVPGSACSCAKQAMEIWYCEDCKAGVTELKFHLSDHVRGSLNGFMEVSGLVSPAVLDGKGVQVSDGVANNDGSLAGPSIKTTTKDFIIARYFSDPPLPTAVTPSVWTYNPSYAYGLNLPPDTYQPMLAGAKSARNYCMSVAAFKIADSISVAEQH